MPDLVHLFSRILAFCACLVLSHCQVSWYVKGMMERDQMGPLQRIANLEKSKNICLVSSLRFLPPLKAKEMVSFDPFEEETIGTGYKIQTPTYSGLDPEFVLFLQERLKQKANFSLKTQVFGIPDRYRQEKVFELLNSAKSFERYKKIAELKTSRPVLSDLLKSYADIMDQDTHLLYGSEDPYSHQIDSCDVYLYFLKYRSVQDSYNSLLFLLTLGIVPDFKYQNHYYDLILRDASKDRIETKTFVFGHRTSQSWFYLPTLGLLHPVSSFDKDYQFSEESEEMFLDAITEVIERSL